MEPLGRPIGPEALGEVPARDGSERCSPAESALLAQARSGDAEALASLWQSNRRWVAVVLLAHKPAEVDLEDLMQEVALTLVSRLDDLREESGFRGWLRVVAVNAARAAARRAGIRRMARLHGTDETSLQETSPGKAGTRQMHDSCREEAQRLLSLAMSLEEEYREPLLLKSLHNMTYRQIGTLLGLPETTVETRITRARRMVRDLADSRPAAPPERQEASRAAAAPAVGPNPHRVPYARLQPSKAP